MYDTIFKEHKRIILNLFTVVTWIEKSVKNRGTFYLVLVCLYALWCLFKVFIRSDN